MRHQIEGLSCDLCNDAACKTRQGKHTGLAFNIDEAASVLCCSSREIRRRKSQIGYKLRGGVLRNELHMICKKGTFFAHEQKRCQVRRGRKRTKIVKKMDVIRTRRGRK